MWRRLTVLCIATLVGLILYNIAPPEIEPGIYNATITMRDEATEFERTFTIEFARSGSSNLRSFTLNGTNTNITVSYYDKVLIAPRNPLFIKITVQGARLTTQDLSLRLENSNGFFVTLNPTRQSGQNIYIEYQPLVQSRVSIMILGIVAVLWFTEGISLVATAFLIPTLVVLTGIYEPTEALTPFFDPAVVLILGGLLIGRALVKHGVDKRLALMILSTSASSGRGLVLAVMSVTAFLSLWMSNAAAAAIMMPIALAVIGRMENDDARTRYGKVLVLGVAYCATIGGVGTLVGTTPNPLASSYVRSFLNIELSFVNWLPFGLPIVLIMIPIVWQVLLRRFRPPLESEEMHRLQRVSRDEYAKLGPLRRQEVLVVAIFVGVVALWVTEKVPDFIVALTGWTGHGIPSAIVALIGGLVLLSLGLLDEKDVSSGIGWSSLLILGSGIVLGSAMIDTGISAFIAQQLMGLGVLPNILVVIIVGMMALLVTIIASNTGAAVILIPIAIPLATSLGIDPLLVTMVIAICVSMDFVLPTGTPPTTMAYSTGKIELRELVTTGSIVVLLSLVVVTVIGVTLWTILGLVRL